MQVTTIDFYVLGDDPAHAIAPFACRLIEKAYRKQHSVHLHCSERNNAITIDEQLWAFRRNSFVPHCLVDDSAQMATLNSFKTTSPSITIGYTTHCGENSDVLLNLSESIPEFFSRFERVIELVENTTAAKTRSRKHYQYYRDRGYRIKTHKL